MPYVNIKITKEGNVTPEQKRALIEGASNLLHDVLGKTNPPPLSPSTRLIQITGASAAYR